MKATIKEVRRIIEALRRYGIEPKGYELSRPFSTEAKPTYGKWRLSTILIALLLLPSLAYAGGTI